MFSKMFCVFALALVFAVPAFADKCKDPIVDEVNALSSDGRTQIEKSMNTLAQKGADVRVHVVSSFHRDAANNMNKSLDGYKSTMKDKCKSWQSADGGMKNNLILVLVAPKQKTAGLYNGDQWQRAVEPVRQQIYDSSMNPRFREGKIADGIAKGLDDVIDVVSVKPSQANKPVTIVHAADNSGLWSVLKWIVFLSVVGGLIFLVFWLFRQNEGRRGAQRNAQTERGKCTQAINEFDGRTAVLSAKFKQAKLSDAWLMFLSGLIDETRSTYDRASSDFSALDRSSNNPDTPRLSVEEYAGMEQRYAELAGKFAEAYRKLDRVESELRRALNGEPVPVPPAPADETSSRQEPRRGKSSGYAVPTSSASRSRGGVSGGHSSPPRTAGGEHHESGGDRVVVVHDGSNSDFMTGVLVGNALGHHDHDHYRDRDDREDRHRGDPVIATPNFGETERPSRGGGKADNWGTTSEGGGEAQNFGKTSDGGGKASSWDDSSSKSGTSY